MSRKETIVIGAGLGGLATALRLAHRGNRVTLLEKTDQVGGRNRDVRVGESEFDGGPTLLMMRDPFEKLFRDVGEDIDEHLDLRLCDPSYRVFFQDGSTIEGTPNVARMVKQIEELSGREDALAYPKLLGDLAAMYQDAIPNFVRKNFYSPLDFAGPKQLGMVMQHRMLGNFAKGIERYVQDPRLRMLFSFQTMYLGMSPYVAPWVYAVLTYMEYGEGIWYPMGGMPKLCQKVAELAEARGAEIRLNTTVSRVDGNQVVLESGEVLTADAVVSNADLPYTETKLSTTETKKRRYSCSALMFYMDYRGELDNLLHHNVYFGRDFQGNMGDLFADPPRVPEDPAFYACVSSKTDPNRTTSGHENLYILVPIPNLDRELTPDETEKIRKHVFGRLCATSSFDPDQVVASRSYGAQDWATELNLDKGAAFGLSHDFWQSAFFRPSNRSKQNPDLYYVGASTQPGNGLPMVLISAELIEERFAREGKLSNG